MHSESVFDVGPFIKSVFLYLEGTFPVFPTCDPTCERKNSRKLWNTQRLFGNPAHGSGLEGKNMNKLWCGCHMTQRSHLLCSSLMRTIMFRWPWEYCSITSRTSYGFLACCGRQTVSMKAIVITDHYFSGPLGIELPRFVIIAQFNSITTAKVCKRSQFWLKVCLWKCMHFGLNHKLGGS